MSYTYEQRKKQNKEKNDTKPLSSGKESVLPNSVHLSQMGHQVGMPEVMREKMEGAFGMDLSGVKLYENKAVGDAGAEAVTQGSKIAFAPGKLDFSSIGGQELLGHEISHVASQARGEVQGSGFVNDSALEARADEEGSMAARGERITAGYGGASAPLSTASAASAAAPMQAKSGKKRTAELAAKEQSDMDSADFYDTSEADTEEAIDDFDLEAEEAKKKRRLEAQEAQRKKLIEEQQKRNFEREREKNRAAIRSKYRYSKKSKPLDEIYEDDEDNFDENRVQPDKNKVESIQDIVRKNLAKNGLSYDDFDKQVRDVHRARRKKH